MKLNVGIVTSRFSYVRDVIEDMYIVAMNAVLNRKLRPIENLRANIVQVIRAEKSTVKVRSAVGWEKTKKMKKVWLINLPSHLLRYYLIIQPYQI